MSTDQPKRFLAFPVLLGVLALTACTESADRPGSPRSDLVAAAGAVATGSRSPSPLRSPAGDPRPGLVNGPLFDVRKPKYGAGVTPTDVAIIEQALDYARRELRLPHDPKDEVELSVYASSNLGKLAALIGVDEGLWRAMRWGAYFTGSGPKIALHTGPAWHGAPIAYRYQAVLHECVHVVTSAVGARSGPTWIDEGMAGYVTAILSDGLGVSSLASDLQTAQAESAGVNVPLRSLQTEERFNRISDVRGAYGLAMSAVGVLLHERNRLTPILRFWRSLGRSPRTSHPWERPFRRVFGMTAERFYEEFEAQR